MLLALPYLVPLNIWLGSSRDDGSKCCWLARLHIQILSWDLDGGGSCGTVSTGEKNARRLKYRLAGKKHHL